MKYLCDWYLLTFFTTLDKVDNIPAWYLLFSINLMYLICVDQSAEKESLDKPKKRFVIAKFSHFGRNSDELSFKEGDVIEVLEIKSETWLYGKLLGSTGYVPENYVTDYVLSRNGHSEISNTESLAEKLRSIQHEGSSNQKKAQARHVPVVAMRKHDDVRLVVQDFKAGTEFELSLHVGDIVHVLREINNEWSEVKNNKGNIGFAPNSCMEYVKTSPQTVKKSSGNVQRSQTFIVTKTSSQTDKNREKLYRTTSCQPAISTDVSNDGNDSLSKTETVAVDMAESRSPTNLSSSKQPVVQQARESIKQRSSLKDRSGSEKRRSAVKRSNAFMSDKNAESTSSSEVASKNWNNDNSSITSKDSAHSNTVPSSSCSTASSESFNKSRPSSFRGLASGSDSPARTPKGVRVNRAAPPPPTVTVVSPDDKEQQDHVAVHESQNRNPPLRPPKPIAKNNPPPPPSQSKDVKITSTLQKEKIEKVTNTF